MAGPTLAELTTAAAQTREPSANSPFTPALGGVDPLGLRQVNFDLMDLVIPGLNNVVRYIRPFTVISWAWRRAAFCAQMAGKVRVTSDELQDFVDRIEVLFVWSQLLRDRSVDLPGRDFLGFLTKANSYTFGGATWRAIRNARKYSTALSAPVNYGPALKSLGWIEQAEIPGVYKSTAIASPAIDALDRRLDPYLSHPGLSELGEVSVSREDVERWGKAWALNLPSAEEQNAVMESFTGELASKTRRDGISLILTAVKYLGGKHDVGQVRSVMCGVPTTFQPPENLVAVAEHWRAVQARQLFRLVLESLLHWVMVQLEDGPRTTSAMAVHFIQEAGAEANTQRWLADAHVESTSLVDGIVQIQRSLTDTEAKNLPLNIRAGLAASLFDVAKGIELGREDRLPLERARREARQFLDKAPTEFMEHVLGSWVFGQHVYWAVGRGLGDARSRGKTILRLKVVPEENGWTLAPGAGANLRNPPRPTPDRLESTISLMREAKML